MADTCAAQAGIRAGDRLTKVQGTPIANFEDLRLELGKFAVGDKIAIELERPVSATETSMMVVDVFLGEEPRQ